MKIALIGGGAAGLMAACALDPSGASQVTLYEKNPLLAKKLRITGKGRCNVCNIASVEETENAIVQGGKFLRTALYAFPPQAVYDFFEDAGVPLKIERGGRVFPVSDKASHIAEALIRRAKASGLAIQTQAVQRLSYQDGAFLIQTSSGCDRADRVLVATGGKSYSGTGSTGDGYAMAKALGHTIVPPRGGLVPLVSPDPLCPGAMGLSLKNCALTLETEAGKKVYEDFGELLFCHFGLSGPTVLSASSHLDFSLHSRYVLKLDLKPALTWEETDRRVLSDFREFANRDLVNALDRLLPQKLILPLLKKAELDERKKVNLVTRAERARLVGCLKALTLSVTGTRPVEEAIITRGGVALSEIDPRSMESRLVPGLYFAGEVLDADALTGGFNLQIAFSTGHLAGKSLSREES